jgi:hypothetical protein
VARPLPETVTGLVTVLPGLGVLMLMSSSGQPSNRQSQERKNHNNPKRPAVPNIHRFIYYYSSFALCPGSQVWLARSSAIYAEWSSLQAHH